MGYELSFITKESLRNFSTENFGPTKENPVLKHFPNSL